MMDVEKALIHVRDIFVECPKRYGIVTDQLRKIESEIQDISHVIELGKLDAVRLSEMVKEFKKLRKERRKLKNELEILEIVMEFVNFPKPTEKTISKALGNVRSKLEVQGKRTYNMRVRKDLQELIK